MSESSKKPLYQHIPHPKLPRRITAHEARQRMREEGGINTKIAVFLTKYVGTMPIAYAFAILALVGLCGIIGLLPSVANTLVSWTSQSFIQLVMLPVIMVGQAVGGKQQEIISEKSYYDLGQIMEHLDAQDAKIVEIVSRLEQLDKIQTSELLKQGEILESLVSKMDGLTMKKTGNGAKSV